MSEALEAWARRVLSNVAPGLPPLRLRHSVGVARRATAASAALLPPDDAALVRAAAWLHDIGYAQELLDTGCHPIDGARHLRRLGAPEELVELVAYHSGAEYEAAQRGLRDEIAEFRRPADRLLDVLTYADMTTATDGHGVSVQDRIADIVERYVSGDPVHVSVVASRKHLLAAATRVQDSLSRPVEVDGRLLSRDQYDDLVRARAQVGKGKGRRLDEFLPRSAR